MANPMSGIVVCGRIGTNIAGLVFVSMGLPLYIIPTKLFQLTKEVKSQLTKSQICKLEQMPSVPLEVEIKVDENLVVTEVRKELAYQEFGSGLDGCTQMVVQCVVSDEMVRRVWSRQFEVLPIDQRLAMSVMPNVAYKGKFDLHLDLGEFDDFADSEEVNLNNFQPTFRISFVSFTSILPNEDSLIHEAPWNRHIPIVIDVQNYEANEEEYLFGPPQEDPNGHHKYGPAIVIDPCKNIIFSTNYPNEACKLGFYMVRQICYKAGMKMAVSMYPCKYNKCNVVFKYQRVLHEEPFPYDCDEDKNIILLVLVEEMRHEYKDFPGADPTKRYFFNRFTGYIDDPKQLVPTDVGDLGSSFEVWIRHTPEESNPAKFAIVRLGFKMKRKLVAAQKKLEKI